MLYIYTYIIKRRYFSNALFSRKNFIGFYLDHVGGLSFLFFSATLVSQPNPCIANYGNGAARRFAEGMFHLTVVIKTVEFIARLIR